MLGHVIKAGGGENDGEQVLDILARHPATARFIATALVRRFVSDTPPPALVDRAAARFRQTDGDLREVTRTILTSRGVPVARRLPREGEDAARVRRQRRQDDRRKVENALPLVRAMRDLGMPLYFCQPPTGYKDTADAWVNTGALVSRMNFALDLASGKLPGVSWRVRLRASEPPSLEPRSSISAIRRARRSPRRRADAQRVALTLGSPEFQRR